MSGIYIPGMEMPIHGVITVTISSSGHVTCNPIDGPLKIVGKAVPVPDHGRLGDLDALNSQGMFIELDGMMFLSSDQIDHAPTIIPADPEDKEGT